MIQFSISTCEKVICLRILIDSKACVSPGENHLSYTHTLILLTFLEGHHTLY